MYDPAGQDPVSGRYDQRRAGLARCGKAAQAGAEGPGRGHAGGPEADQRFCALPGQTAGPHVKSCLRGYSGPQCTEWRKRLKTVAGTGLQNRLQILPDDAIL